MKNFNDVDFIIGGDGDKMPQLKYLVKEEWGNLRVKLLGELDHSIVRDVMVQGHIFLNTSITESFCIAILEAACCGLLVVTTDVGGVPEVLPPHMVYLAKTKVDELFLKVIEAI